ncbi:oligopeptide ABC transporter, substrate binding protein [Schleiferilactobacillus perolens DSM 12744]|uniref:Oligopeptide ABC transporter, substrate binding protein n=2 Tax=Schleiferilactobacillus perolens TaxID=100468 RepID=A0A0R1MTP1_9LACO|nr:oligopeptide ABC transporter, substrate binding protein [Schleiferilactobacillus perolens DSM 12744]
MGLLAKNGNRTTQLKNNSTEENMKHTKIIGIIGVGLVAVLLAACGQNKQSAAKSSTGGATQTATIQTSSEIQTLDPAQATDGNSLIAISSNNEGLYRLDKNSNPIPGIATKVVTPTDEGKKYVIPLRHDAKWANGDPVTAEDFVYAWQRVVTPSTKASYAYLLDGIENAAAIRNGKAAPSTLGVKAIDKYTLQINMSVAVPYLRILFAFPTFFPANEKFVKAQNGKFGTSAETIIANGPFVLKDWNGTGQSWHFVKNKNYWDAKTVKLTRLNFQVVKETATAFNLFQTGKLDDVTLTGEYAQNNVKNEKATPRRGSSIRYLQVNTKTKGLDNTAVRNIISQVIDRKSLAKTVLGDGSIPPLGMIPQGMYKDPVSGKDFAQEAGNLAPSNVKKAKANWADTKSKVGGKLSLRLLTPDDDDSKAIAEYVQGQIENNLNGISVSIQTMPQKAADAAAERGDFDLYLKNWGADYPDPTTFLDLFKSSSSFNYTNWHDAKYDNLLANAEGADADNASKRTKDLRDAHAYLLAEKPVIPLFQRYVLHLNNPQVKGIVYFPTSYHFDYKYAYVTK